MSWTRRRVLRAALLSAAAAACAPSRLLRPAGSIRLVFYADVHARPGADIEAALDRAAAAISAQSADVIIAGGDLVEAGTHVDAEQARPLWDLYREMLAAVGQDVHHVVGNHDLVGPIQTVDAGADPRASMRAELGLERTYASFEAGGYHFVLLDSIEVTGDEAGYRGFVGGEQLEWLEADLARLPPSRPVIAATHMPLVTAAFGRPEPGGGPADRVVVNAREVLEIFARRRLILVLQAHLHKTESLVIGGTTFLTGGAVCGRWWKRSKSGTQPGFALVSVRGERVQWEYVGYGQP